MYQHRLKIFLVLCTSLLTICLFRLVQMQLVSSSEYRGYIEELRNRAPIKLATVRGKITDKNGKILADDELTFTIGINYNLLRLMDERFWQAEFAKKAAAQQDPNELLTDLTEKYTDDLEQIRQIIPALADFLKTTTVEIEQKITAINRQVWNLRAFLSWGRYCVNAPLHSKYGEKWPLAPQSDAIAEFERLYPDTVERLLMAGKIDIAEMHKNWRIGALQTEDDVLAAQLEFADTNGIEILPLSKRIYPCGSAAAQIIGWVGPAAEQDKKILADDRFARYLPGELGGRDGIEKACETILRGKRGEVIYNLERELVKKIERQPGRDINLSIDIDLQQRIEKYLSNPAFNPNCRLPSAAVVIDVNSGLILAMASLPTYDLNDVRQNYSELANDDNEPLRNRAINKNYPPGSVIKPIILIAGLESGNITPTEIIGCPAHKAPTGWPNCWIFNQSASAHDWQWDGQGGNRARNAIKGSCNTYFSRLADRLDSAVLQQWLSNFGYGRAVLPLPDNPFDPNLPTGKDLPQTQGQISSASSNKTADKSALPPINASEKRYFGIGQGNLRASPLHVANAMATIARGGVYKPPKLFLSPTNEQNYLPQNLNIAKQTLDTVLDGMSAVVNEYEGTAYKPFVHSGLGLQGVTVYGKTGSTEAPENAWFAGFAKDHRNRSVAVAVLIEGGKHGATDAAPPARDIIQFCIESGYIGNTISNNPQSDE